MIVRYQGPKGGPGMPEMLTPTSAIYGAGLSQSTCLITDGRFSGASHGFVIGHVVPEAFNGGPIALVRDGDRVVVDAVKNTIDLCVEEGELAARKREFKARQLKYTSGVLYKYAKSVADASHGAYTD